MICPRCKSEIPDDSKYCSICDKKIKIKKNLFKSKETADSSFEKVEDNLSLKKKLKFLLAVIITVVVVLIILLIVLKVNNVSGINTAKDLSKYINKPILTARNETDIHLLEESKYNGVNSLAQFDYLVESEKNIKIDGVKYPHWAVYIVLNDNDQIAKVQYTDYKKLKKHHKGVKLNEEIDLSKFSKGDKYKKVSAEIDIEPFSVVYADGITTYIYKYYFINSHKDEQGMSLAVVYNKKNQYQYSTSQRISEIWAS